MNAAAPAHTLPDPALSRAVLIGNSEYSTLPHLTSVANNLGSLAAILCDPDVWGLEPSNCKVIPNPAQTEVVVEPIRDAADAAVDTLLVYYAGHGLTDRSGDLYLTTRDSEVEKDYTQIRYQSVSDRIRDSRARRRIVILDCCYSGRAANAVMGDDAPFAAQADIDGSFILTATRENQEAQAPSDQKYTAFTHELVTVLEEGLSGGNSHLSLNEIFNQVKASLQSKSLPLPLARDRNNLGSQTSFRNKAFVPGGMQRGLGVERDAESQEASRQFQSACIRASADFLRSKRLAAHDSLYLSRPIDERVETAIHNLSPVNLRRVRRVAKARRGSRRGSPTTRVAPPQAIVLSDEPGSGKTMLAVQLSRTKEAWGAALRHATDPVAEDLRELTDSLGQDRGLSLLLRAGMPLVMAIDGLDQGDANDQREAIELFKVVDELNELARGERLLAFPIAILFTVREAEWDRWFTIFEGRSFVELRGEISRFTPEQLDVALSKYCATYDYELHGDMPASAREKLSLPLNLRLLSESHQYHGRKPVSEVLKNHLLDGFVQRKVESITGMLPDLRPEQVTESLSALAAELILTHSLTPDTARAVVHRGQGSGMSRQDAESLLRALTDEQILEQDSHGVRFGQPGLLEYLVASEGVQRTSESGTVRSLEELTSRVATASPASAAAVRSSVEELARGKDPDTRQIAREHYASSAVYASSRLSALRFELSAGGRTDDQDLTSIYGSLYSLDSTDAWDAFFVVVAAANRQPPDRIVKAFVVAWDGNVRRTDRWKLLYKLRERELLYRDEVIRRILQSDEPRDWETFLGSLAQERDRSDAMARLEETAGRPLRELIRRGPAWKQAKGLLELLLDDGIYVSGRVW